MTTGREVTERALCLMGYGDLSGEVRGEGNAALWRLAPAAVAQITAELCCVLGREVPDTLTLDDPLPLPRKAIDDPMPYGVAALLALSQGDRKIEERMTMLYDIRRAVLLGHRPRRRVDRLP